METYLFCRYNMPILRISFKMSISHELAAFHDSHPITFYLFSFFYVAAGTPLVLFDCYRCSIKVLKDDESEVGRIVFLIESHFYVGLSWLSGLQREFRGYRDIALSKTEFDVFDVRLHVIQFYHLNLNYIA